MKTVWMFLIVLFPSLFLMAQPEEGFRNYYTGTIGDSERVQMDLTIYTGRAEGRYYSENSLNGDISLEGGPSSDGNMELRETSPLESVSSGVFSGKLSPFSMSFEGVWKSIDGKTSRPFKLIKVAEYLTNNFGDGFLRAQSDYPHFLSKSPQWQNFNLTLDDESSEFIGRFLARRTDYLYSANAVYRLGWEYLNNYLIRYYSDSFASMLIITSTTTSEEHPEVSYMSKNILFEDGKQARQVTLAELFRPGADYVSVLSEYILKDLKNQEATLIADSSIKKPGSSDLEVFSVTPNYLEFTFSPGRVSQYEDGAYVVRVPYEAIAGYINRDGILKRILSVGKN